ncbi:hypothetical protein DFH08DRAFT_819376 [Mycena albidolilacea]|uniref:Uncharacterized protein n=1 Tax=Mycena albidolilacea TaxID=1033008 RepID=A0AAD7EFB4_9AGAR|nr:hypothetical protein DFH08DRAFT_819376 [Mycena albidolilacea]
MRFTLLALSFALIGAAAAAAVRSENLVESSLQGRQSCMAEGESCSFVGGVCCDGLRCRMSGFGPIRSNWRQLYSSRIGEEPLVGPSVRLPGSVWKQSIGVRLKYQK